jgi:hypothetical protein
MSSALVLASVTAILRNLLANGLVDRGVTSAIGSDTTISALPPDRIEIGSEEKPQINLFLYQTNPKGLYTTSRHIRDENGNRSPRLPTAMELHYLLTAYGAQDFQTEILLGYALEVMHEAYELPGDAIRSTLASLSSTKDGRLVSPSLAALAASDLGGRFQLIKICPQTMDTEVMFNLWSAFQVSYRPSVTYKVFVELANTAPE